MSSGPSAIPTTYTHLIHRRAPQSFKVCPLCGTLNVAENADCFVCGWQGRFDSSAATVETAMKMLLDRCPRAAQLARRRPSAWARLWRSLSRRRINLEA